MPTKKTPARRSPAKKRPNRRSDGTVLIVFNPHDEVVSFTLPACAGGSAWSLMLETSHERPRSTLEVGDVYGTPAHSLVLFVVAVGCGMVRASHANGSVCSFPCCSTPVSDTLSPMVEFQSMCRAVGADLNGTATHAYPSPPLVHVVVDWSSTTCAFG